MSFNIDGLPKEIRGTVKVIEKGDKLELTHPYIDNQDVFKETRAIIESQGGVYFGYYAEAVHWEIPKTNMAEDKTNEVFKPQPPKRTDKKELQPLEGVKKTSEKQQEESEKEYDIKESIQKVGHLYPVLKDAHGNVIDGFHRLAIDSDWPVEKLDHITDPLQLEMARLIANSFRRGIPASEKTERLTHIAEMTDWDAQKIADNLPISYRTVLRYLPDELKDEAKAEAGRVGGLKSAANLSAKSGASRCEAKAEAEKFARRRQPKSEDIRKPTDWIQCEAEDCKTETKYKPDHIVDGKLLCSKCYRKTLGQEAPTKNARTIEPPQPQTPPPIPISNWEICDNEAEETCEIYPYEVIEDGNQTIALFVNEVDASTFVTCKEKPEAA